MTELFELRITLGNLLAIVTMIISIFIIGFKLSGKLSKLETCVKNMENWLTKIERRFDTHLEKK